MPVLSWALQNLIAGEAAAHRQSKKTKWVKANVFWSQKAPIAIAVPNGTKLCVDVLLLKGQNAVIHREASQ